MQYFLQSFESIEFLVALFFFVAGAIFYGSRSTDVQPIKSFPIALGSFFMSFMIWGTLFTIAWIVLMLFGIHIGLRPFLPHMLHLLMITVVTFYLSYFISSALRIGR